MILLVQKKTFERNNDHSEREQKCSLFSYSHTSKKGSKSGKKLYDVYKERKRQKKVQKGGCKSNTDVVIYSSAKRSPKE